MEGEIQQVAAAASGMSERSVRNWRQGALPSEKKDSRRQRTRPDPFCGVWTEVVGGQALIFFILVKMVLRVVLS